jgi:hypothetical protein
MMNHEIEVVRKEGENLAVGIVSASFTFHPLQLTDFQ